MQPTQSSARNISNSERYCSRSGTSWRIALETEQAVTSAEPKKRALIVAAEKGMRIILRSWLEKEGFAVCDARDLESAAHTISSREVFSVVICDDRLPDGTGLQFMHWLRQEVCPIPFLLITGWRIRGLTQRWGFDYLVTPFDSEKLHSVLCKLMHGKIDDQRIKKLSASSANTFTA